MTIDPSIETQFTHAVSTFHAAASALSAATRRRAFAQTRAFFPNAVTLHVRGEYGDEGNVQIRAQKVTGADGKAIAGYDDADNEDLWDTFTDVVDPDLDWLGELNPSDWVGDDEITEDDYR